MPYFSAAAASSSARSLSTSNATMYLDGTRANLVLNNLPPPARNWTLVNGIVNVVVSSPTRRPWQN